MARHNKKQQKSAKTPAPAEKTASNSNMLLIGGVVGIIFVATALFVLTKMFGAAGDVSINTVQQSGNSQQSENTQLGGAQAADAQEIRMTVTSGSYVPSTLTVDAGKPVRWVIDGTKASGCTTYIISTELGVSKRLIKGENIVEFIAPKEKGTYGFSCGMNMVKGTMNVV